MDQQSTEPVVPRLSDEQKRIILLVANGWTDARIAHAVNASPSTVRRRLRDAATALGVNSRVTLAVTAVRLNLIEDPPAVARALARGSRNANGHAN